MRILLFCAIVLIPISTAVARIINVPGQYATIQAGINASVNSDTVLVAPGTYTENLLVESKNIVLKSAGSSDNTTIQGYIVFNGMTGSIDTTCILQGFKIYRNSEFAHDLIEINIASPKILGNIIQGSSMWPGSQHTGVDLYRSNAIVRANIIKNNTCYFSGHGISSTASFPLIEGNIIWGNGAGGNAGDAFGWGVALGSCIFRYNLVGGNGATSGEGSTGGGIYINGPHCEVTNNTIVRNGSQGYPTIGNTGGIEFTIPPNGDQIIIKNNIIAFNWYSAGATGHAVDSNWTGWDYNLVFGNDTIDYRGFQPGPHDMQVNPLFVNADSGNFHLRSNSPCINAGDPSFPRDPDSSRCDIGAYFFAPMQGIGDPGPSKPYQFALKQNYPNPFNAQTTISYYLTKPAAVSLRICSITGAVVALLMDREAQAAGDHRLIWDGTDRQGTPVSTGIYFYELYIDSYRESKAMILVK